MLVLRVHAVEGPAAARSTWRTRWAASRASRIGPIDVAAVFARRDEASHDFDDSAQLPWLEKNDVTLIRGHGRIDGERRVVVGDETLVARRAVVVATGSRARVPDIPGLRDARPWTNREATTASEVPGRLAILGGGVVGVEMAQAWSGARLAGDARPSRRPTARPQRAVRG